MVQIGQFMLGLTQNVSLLALLIVGYVWIRRVPQMTPALRDTAIGLLFGLGAVAAILTSIDLGTGLLLDGRTILVALAPLFGGWIAALLTDVMAIGFRIWLGGPLHAPWLDMVVASLLGIAFWRLQRRRGGRPGFLHLWLLGILISGINLSLILLRGAELTAVHAGSLFEALAAPLLIVNPLATAILGLALQREDDRLDLERRLDEQTDLFKAIFGAMSDGVTVANAKGEMVMRNPKAVELAGATPKLPAIKDWDLAFGTQEVDGDRPFPGTELPLVRAVRGESSDDVELDVVRIQDGSRRTLSVSGRPLLDRDGKPRGGVAVFRDITAQRRAAQALQKSELRLKDAISAMDSGFALYDAEDRLVLCNEAFIDEGQRRVFGNPIGHSFEEIVRAFMHGDPTAVAAREDPEAFLRWRLELHRTPPETPTEMLHTDGQWMRFTERVTAEGGRVAIWTDVTPLKQAELRLRNAIDNVDAGFALLDPDLRFVTFNQRLLEQYPRSAHLVVEGARLEDVIRYGAAHGEYAGVAAPAEIEALIAGVKASFAGERDVSGEVELADGRWSLVNRHRTEDGGHVVIRTDVTALKRQQRDLEAANRKLQDHAAELAALASKLDEEKHRADAANQEKSIFLAGMSHEIRTPLNGILGFADMITQEIYGPVAPPRYRDYAELIHQSGAHLLSLINDILDLSKIEAGKAELRIEALRPRALAEAAVTLVARLARDNGVGLGVDLDPECEAVQADARSAKQMILNLLSNAVKFTPCGGEVRLSIRRAGASGVEIAVRDNGVGMTEEELRTALAVYGQVDGVASRLHGTGLGLPLTKALAELHGGRLEIVSRKGAGTTATIHLPQGAAGERRTA
ncbi:PAS-domain containing protein [Dongia sp.]|uniref:PAS-domain containing protein n=1 Tax=Dongia sp. TaxID=1977262 RepID=UPI0037503B3E